MKFLRLTGSGGVANMIRWTSREWREIAEWLVAKEVDPERHGWRGEVITAMRAVIPKDRWRAPHSLNEAKKTLTPIMAEVKRLGAQKAPPEQLLRASEAKSGTQNELATEFLLVELAKRLAGWLERPHGPVYEPVDRGFYPPPIASGYPEAKTLRPRILLVGPMNGQQKILIEAHPGLDLRFVASDMSPTRITEVGRLCDELILWTNYISHQHQVHAKATGRPVYLATGGLSALHKRLHEWEAVA